MFLQTRACSDNLPSLSVVIESSGFQEILEVWKNQELFTILENLFIGRYVKPMTLKYRTFKNFTFSEM